MHRPIQHQDRDVPVEARRQTLHKLELMDRYWAAWLNILVAARRVHFCRARLWLVDGFAGSGLHISAFHPDGARLGTPAQAVHHALRLQQTHPDIHVTVHAVEVDPRLAARLGTTLRRMRGEAPDWVSVHVWPKDFAEMAQPILDEIVGPPDHAHSQGSREPHRHRSLWFLDPYSTELAYGTVAALQNADGCEVIVNLDLAGLWRLHGAADEDMPEERWRAQAAANNARLARVFGGDIWATPTSGRTTAARFQELARRYADSFPGFEYRNVYPLRASGSQDRYMIHLSHAPAAVKAFQRAYTTALTVDTVAGGEALTASHRARAAEELFQRHRGQSVTIDELFDLGVGGYSRTQLAVIAREADDRGVATYDETARTIRWLEERRPEVTLWSDR